MEAAPTEPDRSRGGFHLHVLNPGGKDPVRSFSDGAGSPDDDGHPPVNYHAYAACTHGLFARSVGEVPGDAVLLLLRGRHLGRCLRALRTIKARGLKVFISWKESGLHQVSSALADAGRWREFALLAAEADGFVSSTPDLVPIYQAAGAKRGGFVPTPYPVEHPAWDFRRPLGDRRGIFLGTREFSQPTRNHLASLACLANSDLPLTVLSCEGAASERLIREVVPSARIIGGRLPYPRYLELMASHRLVFQLDRSAVPGQVAGDALLCRMPCIGGDGAIERLTFPGLHSRGRDEASCVSDALRLMADDAAWEAEVLASRELALSQLSFESVARQLETLCA